MEKYDREMYSILDLDYLNNFINKKISIDKKKDIEKYFEVQEIFCKKKNKNCISVSLFAQNVNNISVSKDVPNFKDQQSNWYKKYYSQLIKFIENFNSSEFYQTFTIRIYLENQLFLYKDDLLSKSDNIEIYYMKYNSIGAQPGTLWRFLTFDDKDYEIVFCSDVDVEFNYHLKNPLHTFMNKNKTMGRLLQYKNNYIIDKNNDNSAMNYEVCLASMIAIRTSKLDVNMKNIIVNYILYRNFRLKTTKPWEEFDDRNTSRFNKPVLIHDYGWGGIWTMYGFDEKLFKHTLFPYLIQKGEVLSWCKGDFNHLKNSVSSDNPFIIDLDLTLHFKNEIVSI
jgi:hypothetical protein